MVSFLLLQFLRHALLFSQQVSVANKAKVLANAKQVTPVTASKKPQSSSEDSDSDSSSSDGNNTCISNFYSSSTLLTMQTSVIAKGYLSFYLSFCHNPVFCPDG